MRRQKKMSREECLKIRRNIRDSVFQSIITRPGELRKIYLSLYPEDTDVKEEDLTLIRTEPVFIGGAIHDCCFRVRDEKAIFIEVQSTLCKLLPERMLCYYAETITRICTEFEEKQYSVAGTRIPEPEFFVVHVGDNPESVPEYYEKKPEAGKLYIPLRVKTEYNAIGLLKEYCLFSALYRAKQKEKGKNRREKVAETLKECLEKGIMTEFIGEHYKEVARIMSETNEYYFMKYVDGLTKDAQAEGEARGEARGRVKGHAEGRIEGEAKERKASLLKLEKLLRQKGYSPAEAKSFLREYSALK